MAGCWRRSLFFAIDFCAVALWGFSLDLLLQAGCNVRSTTSRRHLGVKLSPEMRGGHFEESQVNRLVSVNDVDPSRRGFSESLKSFTEGKGPSN